VTAAPTSRPSAIVGVAGVVLLGFDRVGVPGARSSRGAGWSRVVDGADRSLLLGASVVGVAAGSVVSDPVSDGDDSVEGDSGGDDSADDSLDGDPDGAEGSVLDDEPAPGTRPFGSGTVRSGSGNASGSIGGSSTPAAARPDVATSTMAAGSSRNGTCSISVLETVCLLSTNCGSDWLAITTNGLATTAAAIAASAIEGFGLG